MGVPQSVYIGPYAEWVVRPDEPSPELEAVAPGELLKGWGLARAWGRSYPPEVEVDEVVCQRFCFVADDDRAGQPRRQLYHSEAGAIADLRGVDAHAEMEWFARAFREELRALQTYYNRPPAIGWGLVTWLS
jgi:hypothetical protein